MWGRIEPPHEVHSTTSVMTPEPTVLPPSRMAKWLPMSRATGLSRLTATRVLSPGITISMPSGNCISPARVHTPFVDGYLRRNYPGKEQEMFEKLESSQPIGRMGRPEEIAALALYLCSDEASFITGSDYPIDGGFLTLRG